MIRVNKLKHVVLLFGAALIMVGVSRIGFTATTTSSTLQTGTINFMNNKNSTVSVMLFEASAMETAKIGTHTTGVGYILGDPGKAPLVLAPGERGSVTVTYDPANTITALIYNGPKVGDYYEAYFRSAKRGVGGKVKSGTRCSSTAGSASTCSSTVAAGGVCCQNAYEYYNNSDYMNSFPVVPGNQTYPIEPPVVQPPVDDTPKPPVKPTPKPPINIPEEPTTPDKPEEPTTPDKPIIPEEPQPPVDIPDKPTTPDKPEEPTPPVVVPPKPEACTTGVSDYLKYPVRTFTYKDKTDVVLRNCLTSTCYILFRTDSERSRLFPVASGGELHMDKGFLLHYRYIVLYQCVNGTLEYSGQASVDGKDYGAIHHMPNYFRDHIVIYNDKNYAWFARYVSNDGTYKCCCNIPAQSGNTPKIPGCKCK